MREADFEAIEAAWEVMDTRALTEAGKRVGLALSIDHLVALEQSIFDHKSIVSTMAEALAHPAGLATCGGATSQWNRQVCLVVKHAGFLTIGIKPVVKETVSPAGAWPELKPWFKDLAKNRARAEKWAIREDSDLVKIPLLERAVPAHDIDEQQLVEQIVDDPHDRAARLVLADRLLEREDVRGDLIRIDEELRVLPPGDPRQFILEDKRAKLLAEHGKRLAGRAGELAEEFAVVGGFVDAITISATKFKRHGAELFTSQPIREVAIRPYNDEAIEALANSPHLARVRSLTLAHAANHERTVLLAPLQGFHFERLEELSLISLITVGDDGEMFLRTLDAPRLRTIRVAEGVFGAHPLRGLAANRALCAQLDTLTVADVHRSMGENHVEANAAKIAGEAFDDMALPNLKHAAFYACWIASDARMADLVRNAPNLVSFEAAVAADRTFEQLVRCRSLEHAVIETPIAQPLFEALLALPRLRSLRVKVPEAEQPRFAAALFALPKTHSLASVHFVGEYFQRVQRRFPA